MRLLTTTIALGLAFPAAAAAQGPQLVQDYHQHGAGARVLVAAHRAYWRGAPENSLPGIEQAIAHGADMIEIDVQRTSDGKLVLMHDTSVDRTTNGTGSIASKTLAQMKALRLKEGLGDAQAAVTTEQVPTLEEALLAMKGKVLVNLDKAWAFRDQIYDLLVATGTLETATFKSSAPVAEVEAFRARDPKIMYSHIVDDANAADLTKFGNHPPESFEIVFDRLTDPQIQPAAVAAAKAVSRIFINTMWYGLAGRYTDEASLIDPARGWEPVVNRHLADVVQTDNVDEFKRWLRGEDVTKPDPLKSVRVQAEDYSTEGKDVGYHDQEDANQGGAARPAEGIDICDQQGALVACWVRQGEWMKYDVDITREGTYRVSGRLSTKYSPAGKLTVEFPGIGTSAPVNVRNTTSHDAFAMQELMPSVELTRGHHTYYVRIDPTAYQNFNIDYVQFDRLSADPPSHVLPATVGGVVAGTLSLTLGAAPSLGVFLPGVTGEYTGTTTAKVISSALDTTLSVTGAKLANGGHSLEQPLNVRADGGAFAPLAGSLALRTWNAPVVAQDVELGFRQAIGAAEPLRTGAYTSTLTFTLSTTAP